jgi:hypothetical protein
MQNALPQQTFFGNLVSLLPFITGSSGHLGFADLQQFQPLAPTAPSPANVASGCQGTHSLHSVKTRKHSGVVSGKDTSNTKHNPLISDQQHLPSKQKLSP